MLLAWWLGGFYDRVKLISYKDALTQVYNRNFVYEMFPKLLSQANRKNGKLTLTLIDLDNFKSINDNDGHKKGDVILRTISQTFANNIRVCDIIARWGGDEFLILSPFTDKHDVHYLIDRLSSCMEDVTFSFGSATYPDDAEQFDELIKIADENMYNMKKGKNGR